MRKEIYNIKLLETQFKSMSRVMKAIVDSSRVGYTTEGPISVTLTHDNQTMTLKMSKTDESDDS